jgi:hypothetical protein
LDIRQWYLKSRDSTEDAGAPRLIRTTTPTARKDTATLKTVIPAPAGTTG